MSKEKNDLKLPTCELIIEKQFSILESIVKLYRKTKQPIASKDLSGLYSDKLRVGKTLPYYASIGWLKEDKKYNYIPSNELEQYFNGIDKESAINDLVKKLEQSEIGRKLLFYLSCYENGVSEDDIIKFIGSHYKLLDSDKCKVLRLIKILIKLQYLAIKDNLFFYSKKIVQENPNETIKNSFQNEQINFIKTNNLSSDKSKGEINLSISILIDSNADEEKIRKCIKIILEEISRG